MNEIFVGPSDGGGRKGEESSLLSSIQQMLVEHPRARHS